MSTRLPKLEKTFSHQWTPRGKGCGDRTHLTVIGDGSGVYLIKAAVMRSRTDTALRASEEGCRVFARRTAERGCSRIFFYILMRMRSCTKVTFPIDCLFLALTGLW